MSQRQQEEHQSGGLGRSRIGDSDANLGTDEAGGQAKQVASLSHGEASSEGMHVDQGPVRVLWGTHVRVGSVLMVGSQAEGGYRLRCLRP